MNRFAYAALSVIALSTAMSSTALALSPRFDSAHQDSINRLSDRFDSSREGIINQLSDDTYESFKRNLNN